jgi:hypothetical protein
MGQPQCRMDHAGATCESLRMHDRTRVVRAGLRYGAENALARGCLRTPERGAPRRLAAMIMHRADGRGCDNRSFDPRHSCSLAGPREGAARRPIPSAPMCWSVTGRTRIHRGPGRTVTTACPSREGHRCDLAALDLPCGSEGPRDEGCPNQGARRRSGVDPTTSGFPLDPPRTTVLGSASASGSCGPTADIREATHGATSPTSGT